jgi:hypothetical protein
MACPPQNFTKKQARSYAILRTLFRRSFSLNLNLYHSLAVVVCTVQYSVRFEFVPFSVETSCPRELFKARVLGFTLHGLNLKSKESEYCDVM